MKRGCPKRSEQGLSRRIGDVWMMKLAPVNTLELLEAAGYEPGRRRGPLLKGAARPRTGTLPRTRSRSKAVFAGFCRLIETRLKHGTVTVVIDHIHWRSPPTVWIAATRTTATRMQSATRSERKIWSAVTSP